MTAPRKSKMLLIRWWSVCFALLLVAYLTQGVLAEAPKKTKKPATPTSITTESAQPVQPTLPVSSPTVVLPTNTVSPSTTPLPPTPTEIIPPTVTNVPPTATVTVSPVVQASATEVEQGASTSVEPATEPDQPSATPNPPTSILDLPLPSLTAATETTTPTAQTSPLATADDPTGALPTSTQAPPTDATAATTPSPSETIVSGDIPTNATIDSTAAASPIEIQPTVAPTALLPAIVSPLPQLIESDSSAIQQTGVWTDQDASAASGGHYLYSSGSPSDSLSLTFQGSGLDVMYVEHPALGSFAVEIDGQTLLTVEATASSSVFGTWAEIRNLTSGFHTARVYPIDGTIAIDAFAVELPANVDVEPMDTPTVELTIESTVEPTTQPSITPTLTTMPSETAVPTETTVPTETVTSTATSLPMFRVSGQVNSFAFLVPATITVTGGGLRQIIIAQPDGTFTLRLPDGSYQLTVTALYHLSYTSQIAITDQPLILAAITLVAGDVNGDGVIDDKDIHLVTENFGLMAPPAPVAADVNGDGMVNIYDLVVVSANMTAKK